MAHELQIRINVHQTTVNFVLPLFFCVCLFLLFIFYCGGEEKGRLIFPRTSKSGLIEDKNKNPDIKIGATGRKNVTNPNCRFPFQTKSQCNFTISTLLGLIKESNYLRLFTYAFWSLYCIPIQ